MSASFRSALPPSCGHARRASVIRALLVALGLATATLRAGESSPYAGQQERPIKALAESEVTDLLAGKGMGLAKAAELNGYPGPAHVLELADTLALSAEQLSQTEAIHTQMESAAKAIGAKLVAAEQALDERFRSRTIDPATLAESLDRISALQARLREAHLLAHLQQARILNPQQIAQYAKQRGYGSGAHDQQEHQHEH